MKHDLYERITQRIVTSLEQGVRPWVRPWSTAHVESRIIRPLRVNGQPYRGINVLSLWGDAADKGFGAAHWMTFRQAKELGGFVRKGEQGSLVVHASTFQRRETDPATGEEAERAIPFLKSYTVFNADQIEGLPERFREPPPLPVASIERNSRVEAFITTTNAAIVHGGTQASYNVALDRVRMPPLECFADAGGYYATLVHELTHWTRHPTRLDRDLGRKRWGDAGYAMEELVAELGASFLCADLGLEPEPRADHAAYIASWLTVLRDDSRAIFAAAAHAQRAADYLHTLQPGAASPAPDVLAA